MRIKKLYFNDGFDATLKWRMTDICNYSCSYCIRAGKTEGVSKEKIEAENETLKAVAKKINSLLEKSDFSNVKIDLIGGEITLLDLPAILGEIKSKKVTEYNITTNFSQPAEYYINIAKNFPISMTASLHEQCTDIDDFFEKANTVNKSGVLIDFKVETVSSSENQESVLKFIEKCKENALDYIIDRDKTNLSENQIISSSRSNSRNNYFVEFSDGTEKEYNSKAELLSEFSGLRFCQGRRVNTKGLMCTFSNDYIYIEKSTVLGRTKENSSCMNRIPIDDFEILPPAKCQIDFCSICGRFRLYAPEGEELEDISDLLKIERESEGEAELDEGSIIQE